MLFLRPRFRRPWQAPLAACISLAALTCHTTTSFHALAEGAAAIAQDAAPSHVAFAGLTTVNLGHDPTMKQQGLGVADLRAVRPHLTILSVVDPASGVDLSFLRAVRVVVRAPALPDLTVATAGPFVGGSNSVGLDVADVELLPYVRSKAMSATLEVDDATPPPQPLTLALTLTLALQVAQPKGACS